MIFETHRIRGSYTAFERRALRWRTLGRSVYRWQWRRTETVRLPPLNLAAAYDDIRNAPATSRV